MSKTEIIRARIEPAIKQKAEEILQEIGISPSQAIQMFYKRIIICGGLPFEVTLPNNK